MNNEKITSSPKIERQANLTNYTWYQRELPGKEVTIIRKRIDDEKYGGSRTREENRVVTVSEVLPPSTVGYALEHMVCVIKGINKNNEEVNIVIWDDTTLIF